MDAGESGHELHFYGFAEALGPVKLIFDQAQPLFFVDRDEKLPALDFSFDRKPLELTDSQGRPVDGIYFKQASDQFVAQERFEATGVRCYETDVRPVERFLMERFIKGMARISGTSEPETEPTTFRNPKIKASQAKTPDLRLCSLDIETGVTEDRLYSVGVHLKGRGVEEKHVFMLADKQAKVHSELTFYPSESSLLKAFFEWFAVADPDFIIGWHVIGFDLMYLERRCQELGIDFSLARGEGKVVLTEKPGSGAYADISGRVVIDGIPALRGCGYTFPNYKLETVAQHLLKTGKLIASDQNKVAEIERQFREEKEKLAQYNLEDCVLVTRIYEKVSLLPTMIDRTRTAGPLLDRLSLPTAALDHQFLPLLHRKGFVAANPRSEGQTVTLMSEATMDPTCGVYENVAVLDFVNVLPSLIRVFKIDPLAHQCRDVAPVNMPSGRRFSGKEHLLPRIFEHLMAQQGQAAAQGHKSYAKACGLTMKQIYSALSHKNCRFYEANLLPALAEAEHWLVSQTMEHLAASGRTVPLADGDQLMVCLPLGSGDHAGRALAEELNQFWHNRLQQEFGLSSIEVSYGGRFNRLAIPPVKHKDGVPLKRYVAQRASSPQNELVFEGLDAVLSDWTEAARTFSETMFAQFFADPESIEPWLKDQLKRLKVGEYDHALIYRKKIRKAVETYSKNPPAHIRAAQMLSQPGRTIEYVYAKTGPTPVSLMNEAYDYDHYILKQWEPIASWVLGIQGDKVLSKLEEPEQMGLF